MAARRIGPLAQAAVRGRSSPDASENYPNCEKPTQRRRHREYRTGGAGHTVLAQIGGANAPRTQTEQLRDRMTVRRTLWPPPHPSAVSKGLTIACWKSSAVAGGGLAADPAIQATVSISRHTAASVAASTASGSAS